MDPTQVDSLVERLVKNPHDEEALSHAHQAGASDPKSYAMLLERVGAETTDAAYASHWLSEAAHVWSSTLGDAHRAARVLMQAIDRDPTQRAAADRLAQLYRDKGESKALVALLERRVKALSPLATDSAETRDELAAMHAELGKLWGESLQQPKKAAEHFRRASELDPSRAQPPRDTRKSSVPAELRNDAASRENGDATVNRDPLLMLSSLREQANALRAAGDLVGATHALAAARELDAGDAAMQQEYGALIVERLAAGQNVPEQERATGAALLVALAEVYDGEHGLAYSAGALDIQPGHDRALQLYAYYARALQREEDVATRYVAYLQANPAGTMAADARWLLAASYEAAGQGANAIQVLEPLRALGDPEATAKLRDLYAETGQRMPSVPPAPPVSTSRARGMDRDAVRELLDSAQALAAEGARGEAYQRYRQVLDVDPGRVEALSWVEDYLRTKRDYPALRDVLLGAVRGAGQSLEERTRRLREVAGLCEGALRDTEGAVNAWKQIVAIDGGDEGARQSLTRLLEKTQRWDDLANLIEQDAAVEADVEKRIALEKKLATLHENKRRDPGSAAMAWARIADLTPGDDRAIATASKLFEQSRGVDQAARVIADNLPGVSDPIARASLLERLGRLREQLGDPESAGQSYAAAGDLQKNEKTWEAAERCFVAGAAWDRAAQAAIERAHLANNPKLQAQHFARGAEHFSLAGDESGVLAALERAADLDPTSDEHAQLLSDRYTAAAKWTELVQLLVTRGDRLTDKAKRVGVRRHAAKLFQEKIGDPEAARETWWKVLEDGDDQEALERLVDDAVTREQYEDATKLLRRLGKLTADPKERARIALREAELLAEGVGDVDAAVARYEGILADIDPACRPALQAVADLQEARENPAAAVGALERELKVVEDVGERTQIAWRLARLYERLDDTKSAIRSLELVRQLDQDDFDALTRLCELCERTERWDKAADLLAQRIEVEADEAETASLTKRLSEVLADKLERGDEALAALTELADMGDQGIRDAYVSLGDRLGWRGIVATKLVDWWFDAEPSAERTASLRGAFERFVEVGREQDAVRVACEIARSKGADRALAEHLERLSTKIQDLDALSVAHDLLVRDLTGMDRARELARQAEARVAANSPRLEAIQHGEGGLAGIPPGEAEEILERLAAIAEDPNDVIDVYERQVTRCRAPSDRVAALARAAQVAVAKGEPDRARRFFDLALSGAPTDEMVATLESAAGDCDEQTGGDALRRILCAAMAAGGQGARDGGRTRGALTRRAALLVYRGLGDVDQAVRWLGDSLIAHVDPATLDALDGLAADVGDPRRAETTLSRALDEVFDGPLVRQLLARRAKLRRDDLGDRAGAAADLKKLHELSPSDQHVTDELTALFTELGDHRGLVLLWEDLILRGKEMTVRAELARKVARMWEGELADPREAADAWRRVLRMKAGDTDATAGLDRAKANMLLHKPEVSLPVEMEPPPPSPPVEALHPVESKPPAEPTLEAEPAQSGDARPTPVPEAGEPEPPAAQEPAAAAAPAPSKGKKRKSKKPPALRADQVPEGAARSNSEPSAIPDKELPLELSNAAQGDEAEGEIVITDDLADMVDVEDAEPEPDESSQNPASSGKRSIPPPLPRA
jgi:cellulose synthase operon protein C